MIVAPSVSLVQLERFTAGLIRLEGAPPALFESLHDATLLARGDQRFARALAGGLVFAQPAALVIDRGFKRAKVRVAQPQLGRGAHACRRHELLDGPAALIA